MHKKIASTSPAGHHNYSCQAKESHGIPGPAIHYPHGEMASKHFPLLGKVKYSSIYLAL